jgi:hypothetical protein
LAAGYSSTLNDQMNIFGFDAITVNRWCLTKNLSSVKKITKESSQKVHKITKALDL